MEIDQEQCPSKGLRDCCSQICEAVPLQLIVFIILIAGCSRGSAVDAVAIAGEVIPVQDSSAQFAEYFLRSPRNGLIVAGLLDPRQLISETPTRLILQSERLSRADVNGLPLFSITGVTPEFWVQPSGYYGFVFKGPGAYAEVAGGIRPEDWAGVPLEDLRTTRVDGGLYEDLPVGLSDGFDPSRAALLDLSAVVFDGRSLELKWSGVANVIYQVLVATDPEGPYTLLQEFGAAVSGPISITVGTTGQNGYFKLAVVQPTN